MTMELTYAEAARLALDQEMERDPRVWALGEDLGPEGGLAGQYKGLQAKFGPDRIVDTPISESMIMAAGVGAAVAGTRPVVELRFADFAMCAADETVNQAAKIRYMFNGQARVPLVARQAVGMRGGTAAQHSQSTEAWWVHIPGLVVAMPATPRDNHGLLRAAIRCDDPVIYLEHKALWNIKGPVDPDAEPVALGKADRVTRGDDLTLVTWSGMRLECAKAAEALAKQGIGVELIDLRTLWPWDRDMVLDSVARTGRLLIAQEAVKIGGFGAEIAAEAAEALWDKLRAPIRRLGAPRTPVPFSLPLEDACRVTPEQIVSTATEMVASRS
ncbi:MAG TPA: transketolase C-terminal domain-containing protein [Xanthobacteraceae bacterium]|nr:transketolase C-terminal domain-containing protein [Xanthobacteraceae bacterium]